MANQFINILNVEEETVVVILDIVLFSSYTLHNPGFIVGSH